MGIADKDLGREREHLGGFRARRPRAVSIVGNVANGEVERARFVRRPDYSRIPPMNPVSSNQLALNQITAHPWGRLPYMPSAGFMKRPYWLHTRYTRAIHQKRG